MKKRNKKYILIDASLTGGRGPAKQAYEFITACKERNIPFRVVTNKSFIRKFKELDLKADVIIPVELSDERENIYKNYYETLRTIDFDLLVKFGARTASTYNAWKLKKPFIVVDGGLPDTIEEYPSLYAKEGYLNADKYILTTHFPWRFPNRLFMDNVFLGTYPFSKKTIKLCRSLRNKNKDSLKNEVSLFVPEVKKSYDILINLLITADYVANPFDRKTYGAWLTTTQYDQTVGFIRRFITDLGIQYTGKALIFMDKAIYPIVADIFLQYKNLQACFNKKQWNYEIEIKMAKLADVVVSRATNYVPNIAMMGQGGLITTPVPANGYMDEDTAAYQALALGLTEFIPYDDEQYVKKFLAFSIDTKKQNEIRENLIEVSEQMVKNANAVDLILDSLV